MQLGGGGGAVCLLVGTSVQQLEAGMGVREWDQFLLISQRISGLEER